MHFQKGKVRINYSSDIVFHVRRLDTAVDICVKRAKYSRNLKRDRTAFDSPRCWISLRYIAATSQRRKTHEPPRLAILVETFIDSNVFV